MIYSLTGFMGVGKTTVGRELSDLTQLAFTDLDEFIESKMGCTITHYFNTQGENDFRLKERCVLMKIVLSS